MKIASASPFLLGVALMVSNDGAAAAPSKGAVSKQSVSTSKASAPLALALPLDQKAGPGPVPAPPGGMQLSTLTPLDFRVLEAGSMSVYPERIQPSGDSKWHGGIPSVAYAKVDIPVGSSIKYVDCVADGGTVSAPSNANLRLAVELFRVDQRSSAANSARKQLARWISPRIYGGTSSERWAMVKSKVSGSDARRDASEVTFALSVGLAVENAAVGSFRYCRVGWSN